MPRKAQRGVRGAVGGDRLALKVSRRRIQELEILHALGKLGPDELRQDAWAGVAAILVKHKLDRTFLQASKLVVDRTDPIVEPEKTSAQAIANVTIVMESPPALTSGPTLPGVRIELEERNGA